VLICLSYATELADAYRPTPRTASATIDLQLPSRPKSIVTVPWPVLTSHPAEGRSLSWPGWLVTYTKPVYPSAVTHPGTNRGRRRATSLMRPELDQSATRGSRVQSWTSFGSIGLGRFWVGLGRKISALWVGLDWVRLKLQLVRSFVKTDDKKR